MGGAEDAFSCVDGAGNVFVDQSGIGQVMELLSTEEDLVVNVVEMFDNAVAPGLTFTDEDNFDSHAQTGLQE